MEKIKSINCYVKDGRKFVVITTPDGKTYSVNVSLVEYVLNNAKQVKGSDKK